jgi:3-deoxy-manno-octulosonate cytidylyltransferase (CMP-KDO synthetase)
MPTNVKVLGIIPARFASTRFPGKPLSLIAGKSLIQRTYENALKCASFDQLVVATDDQRIFDHVKSFGGNVVMTPENCPTGTDRLVAVIQDNPAFSKYTIILNVQGDEPCVESEVLEKVINLLVEDKTVQMATAVMHISSEEDALNKSVVKCVTDQQGFALYFSRTLIPCSRETTFKKDFPYYKHLGIYGYRKDFLLLYATLAPTPLQQVEDLEQLKVLEHGYRIKTTLVKSQSIGVDTPEDIKKVEQLLCKQNSFSSQAESAHP